MVSYLKNTDPYYNVWMIGIMMSFGSVLYTFDGGIFFGGIPFLSKYLNISYAHAALIPSLFVLAASSLMILAGKLADKFGPLQILRINLLIYSAITLMIPVVQPLGLFALLVMRVLQGFSIGLINISALSIGGFYVKEQYRNLYFSINVSGFGLGSLLGMLMSAWIVPHLLTLWYLEGGMSILIFLSTLFITAKKSLQGFNKHKLHLKIMGLLIIAILSFMLVVIQLQSLNFTMALVWFLILCSSLLLFFLIELNVIKTPNAVFGRVLIQGDFYLFTVMFVIVGIFISGLLTHSGFFVHRYAQYNNLEQSLLKTFFPLSYTLGGLFITPFLITLPKRYSVLFITSFAIIPILVASSLYMPFWNPMAALWAYIITSVILGPIVGFLQTLFSVTIINEHKNELALYAGYSRSIQQLGISLGAPIFIAMQPFINTPISLLFSLFMFTILIAWMFYLKITKTPKSLTSS